MAAFNFFTCEILMTPGNGAYSGTRADIAAIPADADATMAFAHEYVHFLQAVSSVMGFRVLSELVDCGVYGALVLSGVAKGAGDEVKGYHKILEMLRGKPDHAGQAVPKIKELAQSILDEAKAIFMPQEFQLVPAGVAWELCQQEVAVGTYVEPFWGFTTPRGTFRPIGPGMLAEGMARRVDQWLKRNQGYAAHAWADGVVEREFYNGIRTILSQARYAHSIHPDMLDRITVIVCFLGLATPRPDLAVKEMLDRLASPQAAGGLPDTVARTLKDHLVAQHLLHADHYNEVMKNLLHGPAKVMDRMEFIPIFEQLKTIHRGGNLALHDPATFADEGVDWARVCDWMHRYSVPPVQAADGEVNAVNGVNCTNTVTAFLHEVMRVLF